MRKLKDWIYKFDSYNLWVYKNGYSYLTKDYYAFGKKRQRELVGKDLWDAVMESGIVKYHYGL
jgi:hypothetical protein